MGALLNRARMTTATTGTGTITLGSASNGFASFAEAGATNATAYSYCIEDGNDFEIGVGTYTSSGTTFSRDTVTLSKISGTAGTTKLTLSGSATIFITARAQEIATLDAAQTYTATQTITPAANTSALVSSGGSLTGANAQSLIDLAQTWNTSGTPSAFRISLTDTASAFNSLMVDLRVGGNTIFSVRKTGLTLITGDFYVGTSGFGSVAATISTTGSYQTVSGGDFSWSSSASNAGTTKDLILVRDAANVLAQRNGTNAQTFRLYNTFTDASNYERGKFEWASNVLRIGTEKAGTGAARALELQTDGTTRLTFGNTGTGYFNNDTFISTGAVFGFSTLPSGGTNQIRCSSPSDGVLLMRSSGADFGRLQFGGTTSSFPSLKRSSTAMHVRLADDSAFADLVFRIPTTNPGPGTLWNNAGVLTIGT